MAIIPGMTVPAPEPGRRRYGLFDAAVGPLVLPPHGQGGGVRYVPVGCGEAYVYPVDCEEPPSKEGIIDNDDAEIETGVFAVLATLECGAVAYSEAEMRVKVARRLEAGAQAAVERALWSGIDFEGNALPGVRSLTDEAETVSMSFDPDDATVAELVGALERYAYTEQGYGYQAVIHAPIEVAAFAFEAGLVLMDGAKKVTPMGSIWAFGAYPPGSAIITGQTTVWRAPAETVTAFDRVSNQRLLLAEQAFAVSFDCFAGQAGFDPLEVSSS
jgi:hypothetical protein